MKSLARIILKSRANAVGITIIMAIGSLLVPFLGYLSGASVSLVTLRLGLRHGMTVVFLSTVAITFFAQLVLKTPAFGAVSFFIWLPLLVAAMLLRWSVSISLAIDALLFFVAIVVTSFHLYLGVPGSWWSGIIERVISDTPIKIPADEVSAIADIMTGLVCAILFLSLVSSLLIARWWQSLLYNPGGFGSEFRALRINRWTLFLTTIVLSLALFDVSLMSDFSVVVMVLYMIMGLSLIHALNKKLKVTQGWLIGFYGLLLLFPAQVVAIVSAVGFADAWVDFRRRLPQKE